MTRRMWVVGGLIATTALAAALIAGMAASSHSDAAKTGFVLAKAENESWAEKAGVAAEGPEGTPEAEQAALRAYPAAAVPATAMAKAQKAFKYFRNNGKKKGVWHSIGANQAQYPGVLASLGDNAPYTASGRITAMALSPDCSEARCRLFIAAAGGGVWRTDKALDETDPQWKFLSGGFGTNAIGTLTIDPGDPSGDTIYAGTGEPNASADSEAGVGIYKSTDGGHHWTQLAGNTSVPAATVDCGAVFGAPFGMTTAPAYSGPAFIGRAISSIVVQGDTVYVGSTRAVRGVSSASSGGAVSLAPGLPPYGLYKSTDGGATFTLLNSEAVCLNPTLPGSAGIVQASFGSTRGVNEVAADPSNASIIYAAAFPRNNAAPLNTGGGVWRSMDAGVTWTQIKSALNPTQNTDRSSFAVNTLPNGKTRMYVGIGNSLTAAAQHGSLYRTDDATAASPTFTDLTNDANIGYCGYSAGGQCWYDNVVYSPAGFPDVVYVGGSMDYDRLNARNNGRAWMLSKDAGVTWYDLTQDSDADEAEAIHPDQHAIVTLPGNPWLFITGSDGGVVRSDGQFADVSSKCDTRNLTALSLGICHTMLSNVPNQLINMNKDLPTLQFQSFAVNPMNSDELTGGTQDNGTFQYNGSPEVWPQIMYGDGGQSGYSAGNPNLRFNTFTGQANDVNFRNGDPIYWVVATGPIVASPESSMFYPPIIADPNPAAAGSIFQGSRHVWRTQDWGGNQAFLEANCPEFTTSAANPVCGDFVPLSGAAGNNNNAGDLEGTMYGADRAGGNIAAIERAPSNTGTMWVATTTGRLFITDNANAANANTVTWTRLDSTATNAPGRFISGIYVDPANPNHAWVSYSSYSSLTPAQPGQVFEVNRIGGAATWTNLTYDLADLPITDVVRDDLTGDLYASSDFGVFTLAHGDTSWAMTEGLPMVEVAGLTIVPNARILYAATHGLGGWKLDLPKVKKDKKNK